MLMPLKSRFGTICRTLVPPLLAYARTRRNPESPQARRARIELRLALQHLGTTFIKLGQLLSARPDLIGLELADELRNLLDHEPALTFTSIQQIIETETKQPITALFKTIDTVPLGTASIAQVHRAVLQSGREVALKVQRPHVEATIKRDLPVLKQVCRLLDITFPLRSLQFSYLYSEFVDWVTNELDFRVEGRRADRLRDNMSEVDGVTIPEVYWEYTTKALLTMSYIEGMTVNQLLDTMHHQQVTTLYDAELPYPIDPDLLVGRTIAAVAKQALVDRYFHGDLHPANIIVQRHSRVAFVDFGVIGSINAEEHAQIMLTMMAIVQNDPEALVKVCKSLAITPLSHADVAHVHQLLADELHKLQEDGGGRVSLSHFMSVIFAISQEYQLMFTQGFIIAMKTIAQIDSVASQIGLRSSLVALMKPEVEKCLALSLSHELSEDNISGTILNLVEAGKQLPQTLNDLQELIHGGELLPATAPLRTAERAFAAGSIVVAVLLMATAPFALWAAPPAWRPGLVVLLLPLFLLFVLVTMLKSRRR